MADDKTYALEIARLLGGEIVSRGSRVYFVLGGEEKLIHKGAPGWYPVASGMSRIARDYLARNGVHHPEDLSDHKQSVLNLIPLHESKLSELRDRVSRLDNFEKWAMESMSKHSAEDSSLLGIVRKWEGEGVSTSGTYLNRKLVWYISGLSSDTSDIEDYSITSQNWNEDGFIDGEGI